MRRLHAVWLRICGLFRKRQFDAEFAAEMESHLQMHIEDNLRAGMSPAEARRQALIKLGGLEQTKEIVRERRGLPILEVFLQDLRFGARMLGKNPGFTIIATFTLALGIAANSTILSFTNAVLLKRPPVEDPDRVMVVYGTSAIHGWGPNLDPVSALNFFAWKKGNRVFSSVGAAEAYGSANLSGSAEPERVSSMRVTANFFSVLGVSPQSGRTFTAEEEQKGKDHVVLLSHKLWQGRFGADPAIAGKQVRLNGETYTVIGVMPQRFFLRTFLSDLWQPLALSAAEQAETARENRNLYLFARLKPATSIEEARADVNTLAQVSARDFPEAEKGWGANVLPLQDFINKEFNFGAAAVTLESTVGFVLLIACANVAGLFLARATSRRKEIALRIALGAGRGRVFRQLLTEALLIGILGGALGLALAFWGVQLLQANLSFSEEVRVLDLSVDSRVLSFSMAISVLSALLFGLAPGLQAGRSDIFTTLKAESSRGSAGGTRTRLRSALVAAEVALAVILLTGTGVLLKGLYEGFHRYLGFDQGRLLSAQISLAGAHYADDSQQKAFYKELLRKLEQAPGVESAAITSDLPATGPWETTFIQRGQETVAAGERARARYFAVSPHFLETAGIPLLAGRRLQDSDGPDAPAVAVVSEAFVRRYFPKGDAIGKEIRIDSNEPKQSQWRVIVGIAANVKSWPVQASDDPEIYEPYEQRSGASMALLLRARANPNSLAGALREAVWSIDKDQPVGSVASMSDLLNRQNSGNLLFSKMLGIFAALALSLSAIGLYGLVAYTVEQRTQEIGIRVALGAEKRNILGLVLRDGMRLALIGAAIGLVAGLPLPKAIESMIEDFHLSAGWVFEVVPLLMISVALLACYIPARRAVRVDPIVALRYE
jgi:putative ABC transport system permease protein